MPKTIKNGAYVINLDEYANVGTHWIALYVKYNEVFYFDSLDTKTNIFRTQADNSTMCGYICIGFIYFMFAGRSLIDFTSFFSPYDFKKNDKIILIYFE